MQEKWPSPAESPGQEQSRLSGSVLLGPALDRRDCFPRQNRATCDLTGRNLKECILSRDGVSTQDWYDEEGFFMLLGGGSGNAEANSIGQFGVARNSSDSGNSGRI